MKNLKVRNHLATISSPPLSSCLLGLPASNTSIYPLPFSTLYCITIYTWFNTSQLFLFLQIWQMGLAVNENTGKHSRCARRRSISLKRVEFGPQVIKIWGNYVIILQLWTFLLSVGEWSGEKKKKPNSTH